MADHLAPVVDRATVMCCPFPRVGNAASTHDAQVHTGRAYANSGQFSPVPSRQRLSRKVTAGLSAFHLHTMPNDP